MKTIIEYIISSLKKLWWKHLAKKEFNRYISKNPDLYVCPTCLGNCGHCGGDEHYVKLKDLKNSDSFKSGWSSLISSIVHAKENKTIIQ